VQRTLVLRTFASGIRATHIRPSDILPFSYPFLLAQSPKVNNTPHHPEKQSEINGIQMFFQITLYDQSEKNPEDK